MGLRSTHPPSDLSRQGHDACATDKQCDSEGNAFGPSHVALKGGAASKLWACKDHRARGSQQVARGSLPTSLLSPTHSVLFPPPPGLQLHRQLPPALSGPSGSVATEKANCSLSLAVPWSQEEGDQELTERCPLSLERIMATFGEQRVFLEA